MVSGDTLDRWSDDVIGRLKKNPPPEDPETQRYVVVARGKGPKTKVRAAALRGTSPYAVTGFLCAMASKQLLAGKALRHGYASIAQALGGRYVLDRLAEIGTTGKVEADRAVDPAPRSRWTRVTAQA